MSTSDQLKKCVMVLVLEDAVYRDDGSLILVPATCAPAEVPSSYSSIQALDLHRHCGVIALIALDTRRDRDTGAPDDLAVDRQVKSERGKQDCEGAL